MRSKSLFVRSLALLAPSRVTVWAIVTGDVFVAVLRLAEPILFGRFVDALYRLGPGASRALAAVRELIMLWIGVGVAGIAVSMVVSLATERMVHLCRWQVSKGYFAHVLGQSRAFHARHHSGVLAKTMYDANGFLYHSWLEFFREHVPSLLTLVMLVPLTVYLNWRLSMLVLASILVFVTINVCLSIVTSRGQRRVYEVDMAIADHIHDVLGNVPLVQSFSRSQAESRTLATLVERFIAAQFPVLNAWAAASVLTRACSMLSVVLIFVLGTVLLERGATTVGEIVTFAGFATLIIARLDLLSAFVSRVLIYRPMLNEFFEVMDAREMTPDRPEACDLDIDGAVAFEDVWFEHVQGRPLLRAVSFQVEKGSTVALVGSTGAGKSTAMALLCRFWDPQRGRVLIDGIDVRDIRLDALHRQVGIVLQDNPVLHRSLRDNLLIGAPGATPADLEAATRLVQLETFVSNQEERFDAMLGERGGNISGGERQRLGIARALLKDPAILILDEATSALDAVTEEKIQRLLAQRRQGRTTFVVAHRLSTVRQADLILVMEDGAVVESGDYPTLIVADGPFARLVRAQGI